MKKYKIGGVIFFLILSVHSFSQSYQRIVSLAPSLTNMLYLLGSEKELVGCTMYCEEAKANNISVVASAVEVNIEKVIVLKPDLVIATTLTKPSIIAAFEQLGIKVRVFSTPKSYLEICNQLIEIGKLTGKETLGNSIVRQQQQRLSVIKQTIPHGIKPKVFIQIGAKPLFTAIPNTFMDDYITFSGGVNIASDLKIGIIACESVLVKNPDIIIIVTMGIVGNEEKETWEKYQNITASKNGKVFIIDSQKACSPNPITFIDVVEQLVALMYR